MTCPTGEALSWNVDAIGYTDMDGRPAFKLALHKAGDRWYLYTGQFWHSGFSIVEVTDPANPRFVRFIEGPPNTWTLQVQVADGKLVTSQEKIADGWGHEDGKGWGDGLLIWDPADHRDPQLPAPWTPGGGGTHRNHYERA